MQKKLLADEKKMAKAAEKGAPGSQTDTEKANAAAKAKAAAKKKAKAKA